jgi:ankyrin repeat protein
MRTHVQIRASGRQDSTEEHVNVTASIPQEEIDQFVIFCHWNLPGVRAQVAAQPALLHTRSTLDESPLGAAAHVGAKEIATYLLHEGAELDIYAAAMLGMRDEVLAYLDEQPELANSGGAHGIPLLFHAAVGGDIEMVELLIERGADPQQIVGPQGSALNAAAMRGYLPMAEWLVANGARLDSPDFEQKTPLQRAREAGNGEIEELLVRSGATE